VNHGLYNKYHNNSNRHVFFGGNWRLKCTPGEPALTQGQFIDRMKPGMGYAVIEEGQFQVYVGEFKKL
jgi:hypothetical protein